MMPNKRVRGPGRLIKITVTPRARGAVKIGIFHRCKLFLPPLYYYIPFFFHVCFFVRVFAQREYRPGPFDCVRAFLNFVFSQINNDGPAVKVWAPTDSRRALTCSTCFSLTSRLNIFIEFFCVSIVCSECRNGKMRFWKFSIDVLGVLSDAKDVYKNCHVLKTCFLQMILEILHKKLIDLTYISNDSCYECYHTQIHIHTQNSPIIYIN